MAGDNICSYISNCFVNIKKDYDVLPTDALRSYIKTSSGKEQLVCFLKNEQELSPYVLALINDASLFIEYDNTIIDPFFTSLQLKTEYCDMFKSFIDGTTHTQYFQSFLNLPENKAKVDGIIRQNWFEERHTNTPLSKRKKFGNGRLQTYELRVLFFHFCLLADTNNDTTILSKLWGIKLRTAQDHKKKLRDKFIVISKKYIISNITQQQCQQQQQQTLQNHRRQSQRTPGKLFSPSLKERDPKKSRSSNSSLISFKRIFSPKKNMGVVINNTDSAVNVLNFDLHHSSKYYSIHYIVVVYFYSVI